MALKSVCEAFPVEDPKADHKAAEKLGAYRFGARALYFPGFPSTHYLPTAALRRAWVQKSAMAVKGCCGAQLPLFLLRVEYEGGFFQNFTFDAPRDAERALELVRAVRPDLPREDAKM